MAPLEARTHVTLPEDSPAAVHGLLLVYATIRRTTAVLLERLRYHDNVRGAEVIIRIKKG